jgi:hypothetical protein
MSPQLSVLDVEAFGTDARRKSRVPYLVWGFVILGAIIRLIGYLLRFPLWIDECMLAENFLDRGFLDGGFLDGGFLDLLSPLEHHQVAPIGFLWIELACVRLFGFSEWSLRLFPLLCGIASLFVFRRLASRLLAGVPLVLAMGCLAVAKAPVGLSANAKPYATDLLVAATLMLLAVEWLRQPARRGWLWSLVAAAPLALVLSFPAVFVTGAISVGLFLPLCRLRNAGAWGAYLAYNAVQCVAFAGVLAISAGPPFQETRAFMVDYWSRLCGFPPFFDPAQLPAWFINVHLGDTIFSVPYGAENGGGTVAFLCCIVAAIAMYRRGQRPVLAMCAATFGLTLLAASMQRYPYGGHNRVMQFLVPAISLTVGLGAATLLARVTRPVLRRRLTDGLVLGLVLFGIGVCVRDLRHPYHFVFDEHHREFARKFWQDEPGKLTVCSLTDLRRDFCPGGWYAYYRCNQQIYSPRHHAGTRLSSGAVELIGRPFRVAVYLPRDRELDLWAVAECLKQFEPGFEFAGREDCPLPQVAPECDMYGRYQVFRFIPRTELAQARILKPPGGHRRDERWSPWVRLP